MAFLILDHKHQDRSEIRQNNLGPSYNTSFTRSNLKNIDKTSHFSYCNVFWHNKKINNVFFNPCNALYFDVFFRADTKISRNWTLSVCVVAHSWPKFGWIERTLDFGLKRPISLGFYSDKFVCRNDMLMFWCQSIEHKKLHKTLRLQLELMIS